MTIKDMKIIESLKQIRPKDLIYSGILMSFMVIVGVLFFISTRFISLNVNKVFSSDVAEGVQVLNLERYQLIAKKLGITVNASSENAAIPPVVPPASETPVIAIPTTETIDKRAITITVLNSTAKRGVAGTLAKTLEAAGFATPATGNENTPYAKTTILVKESKYDYAAPLLETVLKSYPGAFATTTPESAPFDATVIIGAE